MMLNLKNNMHKIDFIWSSQKEYLSLKPLYDLAIKERWDVEFKQIHKNFLRNYFTSGKISDNVIISHDKPLKRIKKWAGRGNIFILNMG